MKLKFLGGAGTVTGSKTLVESPSGQRILVDCGLFQGQKRLRLQNWSNFPVDPSTISALILTHAHLDHSGYIPKLVREGFKGKIFCTPATQDLCSILLADSAKIMEEEAEYANKKGFSKHQPALPLYTFEDVERAMNRFEAVDLHQKFSAGDFEAEFFSSGHILGAAFVRLESEKKSVVFSGDLGRVGDPILYPPESIPACDTVVVESTYGDRLHLEIDPSEPLAKIVGETVSRGGTILIPSFTVGRAQHILLFLARLRKESKIPEVPIYLDSPMAINVTELYETHKKFHRLSREELHSLFSIATYVKTSQESKALSARHMPRVIISASGMATGGRVLHHLKDLLPSSANSVVFAGYQAVGTRGASLVSGATEVKIHGQYVKVFAKIHSLENLSAHADRGQILDWLKTCPVKPSLCLLNHGEPAGSEALRIHIQDELGWKAQVAEENGEY